MIRSTHGDNRPNDTSEDEDYETRQAFVNHSDEEQEYEKVPREIGKSWTKENEKLPIKLPDGKIQIIATDEGTIMLCNKVIVFSLYAMLRSVEFFSH